jgi:hypothetical protein
MGSSQKFINCALQNVFCPGRNYAGDIAHIADPALTRCRQIAVGSVRCADRTPRRAVSSND